MVDEIKPESQPVFKYTVFPEIGEKKGLLHLIKSLWTPAESNETKLIGRIHAELHRDAKEALDELTLLKDTLRSELESDPALWNLVETVINPFLREFSQLDRKLKNPQETLTTHHETVKSAADWIEKAKQWAAICSRPHDREGITKAVIAHAHQVFHTLIERDLKMMFDYREHKLLALKMPPQQIRQIIQELDETLSPLNQDLQELKKTLPNSLELLSEWKKEADELRNKYFNQALKEIDSYMSGLGSMTPEEESQDHLTEIFQRLAILEEQIPAFQKKVGNLELIDEEEKKMMKKAVKLCESQIHELNGDLRLTPELIDRVQIVMEKINFIKEHTNKLQDKQDRGAA
jgi:DNA repair exonuclease SbcCD ATPase subunit